MTESISQGLPNIALGNRHRKLFKSNDISFAALNEHGFHCAATRKKPDQFVANGSAIILGIEDKLSSKDLPAAVSQLKKSYLPALPNTKYFIARAGDITKVFFRISGDQLIEIGTTYRGNEVVCFGPDMVTGNNKETLKYLSCLAKQITAGAEPVNFSLEIKPPKQYYNPLLLDQSVIFSLWQKIFVSTGENAHLCLSTFVELLLYKGISDAHMLPADMSISELAKESRTTSLETYKTTVRRHIKERLFPVAPPQPGVIKGFAFDEEETVFKAVLQELISLGNIAQQQLDPDFKRRIIEAFLGSARKEGAIKNGKHLTPRILIQAIWDMAEPERGARIVDPACGVGGFVLEGLNYPYEFDPLEYNLLGIDRDEAMIVVAKDNMVIHILDKFTDPAYNNEALAQKVNRSFYCAKNNGTGTLGELEKQSAGGDVESPVYTVKHPADYVFANVPFYVNGVTQIENSLANMGLDAYYDSCGIGLESRFIRYILGQIKDGNPGIAYVIVTDGILYRHHDKVREMINRHADVLGIVSLPRGCFQNNNWKTSILIFQKKGTDSQYAPVFLYNVENIGVSLDSFRTPIEENDIPNMKMAWKRRASGQSDDPKCRFVARDEFLKSPRWYDLFSWCHHKTNENAVSVPDFIHSSKQIAKDITTTLEKFQLNEASVFKMDSFIEIKLGDDRYFHTHQSPHRCTIREARLHPGNVPLYSSQVDGPVAHMALPKIKPNKHKKNEPNLISWNIKGDPCKDIRLHTSPFYATENRGLIEIKDQNICEQYVLFYLKEHLAADGDFSRMNEAHVGKVKDIAIRIPTNQNGFDLERQNEIVTNYASYLKMKEHLTAKLGEFAWNLQNLDIFAEE